MLETSLRDYLKSCKATFQHGVIDGALGTEAHGSTVIRHKQPLCSQIKLFITAHGSNSGSQCDDINAQLKYTQKQAHSRIWIHIHQQHRNNCREGLRKTKALFPQLAVQRVVLVNPWGLYLDAGTFKYTLSAMAAAAEVKGIVGYIAVPRQVAIIGLEPHSVYDVWREHGDARTEKSGLRMKSWTSYLSGLCRANFDLKTDTITGITRALKHTSPTLRPCIPFIKSTSGLRGGGVNKMEARNTIPPRSLLVAVYNLVVCHLA